MNGGSIFEIKHHFSLQRSDTGRKVVPISQGNRRDGKSQNGAANGETIKEESSSRQGNSAT